MALLFLSLGLNGDGEFIHFDTISDVLSGTQITPSGEDSRLICLYIFLLMRLLFDVFVLITDTFYYIVGILNKAIFPRIVFTSND